MSIEFGINVRQIKEEQLRVVRDHAGPLIDALVKLQPKAGLNDDRIKELVGVFASALIDPELNTKDQQAIIAKVNTAFTYTVGN